MNPAAENEDAVSVGSKAPPHRIVLGITKVACLPAIQHIIQGIQGVENFGEVILFAPESVVRMLDKSSITCRVLSDSDAAASFLQRGRFLYDVLGEWATHIIVVANSDMIAQLFLCRSDGTIPMLLSNFRHPRLVIPHMPAYMWAHPQQSVWVDKLKNDKMDVADCIFHQPTAPTEIVARIVKWLGHVIN